MYIEKIQIRNLRVFNEAQVKLLYPGIKTGGALQFPNANLFLGLNGSGKSTLLKALVLAAIGPVLELSGSGFRPNFLVRRNHTIATVTANLLLGSLDGNGASETRYETKVQVIRRGDLDDIKVVPGTKAKLFKNMYSDTSPAFFLAGYGSGRTEIPMSALGAVASQRAPRYQRVASVFEPTPGLRPLASWLASLTKSRFSEVTEIIDKMIAPDVRFQGKWGLNEHLFRWGRFEVPFSALSDGYRNAVLLASDLLFHLASVCPLETKIQDLPGVVLIDEVDLLLHPEWQSRIVSSLCTAFPKLQFIFTSHSELVVGSLQQENVFIMKPVSGDRSLIDAAPNRPSYGLDAVQLLYRYFGQHPGREANAAESLRLLEDRAARGDVGASLKLMQILAGRIEAPVPGSEEFAELRRSAPSGPLRASKSARNASAKKPIGKAAAKKTTKPSAIKPAPSKLTAKK